MCSTSRCIQGFPLEWRGVALGVGPIGTHSLFVLISKKVLFFPTRPQTDIIHFCRRNPIMGMRRGESVSCLLMEKNGLAINLILMTWDAYPPSVHRKKKNELNNKEGGQMRLGKWNQGETIDQATVRKENGDTPSIGGRFRIPTSSRGS